MSYRTTLGTEGISGTIMSFGTNLLLKKVFPVAVISGFADLKEFHCFHFLNKLHTETSDDDHE